jgi:hypothetical protein
MCPFALPLRVPLDAAFLGFLARPLAGPAIVVAKCRLSVPARVVGFVRGDATSVLGIAVWWLAGWYDAKARRDLEDLEATYKYQLWVEIVAREVVGL